MSINSAWECPRCEKINAPFLEQCSCEPTCNYTIKEGSSFTQDCERILKEATEHPPIINSDVEKWLKDIPPPPVMTPTPSNPFQVISPIVSKCLVCEAIVPNTQLYSHYCQKIT